MNVWLSLGRVWNIEKGMRTGWCLVLLCMLAAVAVAGSAGAEDLPASRTTLAITTDNAGPRTRATLTAHVAVPDAPGAPAGVVTFRSGTLDLGSAFVDTEGNASVQTDLLTDGSHPVVATYQGQSAQGQPNSQTSVSQPEQVQAVVSTVAGFTVGTSPSSLSTVVGGFVNSTVTVTPNNGFSGYVSLSCTGLPINTTCTFTPVSVLAACTSSSVCKAATSVMQIQTQQPSPSATASTSASGGLLRYAFILPVVFGLAGLGGKRRAWRNLALVLLTFAGVMGMSACSQRYRYLNHGPPDNPGTTVGTYTVTIESQSSTGETTVTPPVNPTIALTVTAQ